MYNKFWPSFCFSLSRWVRTQGLSNHSSRCTASLETTTHNIIKIPSLFSLIAGNLEKRAVFTCISRRPTCEVGRRLVLLFYEDEARCLNAIEWSSGPLAALTDAARWASWQLWFSRAGWVHVEQLQAQISGSTCRCVGCVVRMHSSGETGSIFTPELKALPTSFASATRTSKSVASSKCIMCCCEKKVGLRWARFRPVEEWKKTKFYLHRKG